MNRLTERKRLLVAESECHRQRLGEELNHLCIAVGWVDRGWAFARSAKSWLPFLAPIVGFLFVRRAGRPSRFLINGWRWVRLAKKLLKIW